MAKSSIFGSLANASATQGRNPFINRPGITVDEVTKVRAGYTQDGSPYFAVDLKIDSIIGTKAIATAVLAVNEDLQKDKQIPTDGQPHAPGEEVTEYTKLINPHVQNKLDNVRNFCEAVLDSLEVDYSEWGQNEWEAAILGSEDTDMKKWLVDTIGDDGGFGGGDGTLLKGLKLIRSSEARHNKNKNGVYVVSTFSPAGEEA